ncbi:hypothetical protein N0V90_013380, partial [Kalmusia sp. IMI 367209]
DGQVYLPMKPLATPKRPLETHIGRANLGLEVSLWIKFHRRRVYHLIIEQFPDIEPNGVPSSDGITIGEGEIVESDAVDSGR